MAETSIEWCDATLRTLRRRLAEALVYRGALLLPIHTDHREQNDLNIVMTIRFWFEALDEAEKEQLPEPRS